MVEPRPPTLQDVFTRAFRSYHDRPCIRWEGGHATYEETASRVAAVAARLQRMSETEAHVAVLLENSREYIEILMACMVAGRVRVPLNLRDPVDQQVFKLVDSEASVLFTSEAWLEQLRDKLGDELPAAVVVGAPAAGASAYDELVASSVGLESLARAAHTWRTRLTYTGGTTGQPKAVVHTNSRELAVARNLLLEAIRPGSDTTFVAATPLSHASGAFVVPTILMGGSLSWTTGFDADRLVDAGWLGGDTQIQTFVVPTALDDLSSVATPGRHSLDTVVYGGAPASEAVLTRAIDRLGQRLVQVYGQAEAPMTITVLSAADHEDPASVAGCIGRPFLFVDVRLDGSGEVGEILVAGEHVMQAYWRNPDATREAFSDDGYLRTQDLAHVDEAGRLWLVGRSRELIISGGYNVYPAQVERQLGTFPGIENLAVFGAPHPRWGEGVAVAIVPENGADADALKAAVDAAARERLAAYERPKEIVVVESLPKTPVGKVSRAELSAIFADIFEP